jgi:hypothetical protein
MKAAIWIPSLNSRIRPEPAIPDILRMSFNAR